MGDIAFYHLTRWPLEQALPRLLEKTLEAGKRAVVRVGSDARAEALADHLWTYDPGGWLPHGTEKDGHADQQPVWITAGDDTPNGATFLFLTDGRAAEGLDPFERCFLLFDGRSDEIVQAARGQWKALKEAGHDLAYWQQTERGGWEKKA